MPSERRISRSSTLALNPFRTHPRRGADIAGATSLLHISRRQLNAPAVECDPLSPRFGEAVSYEVVAPERGALQLHPSRVVRFLGNAWPDPTVGASVWSDSVLLALYDAVHAVALTTAGATRLMHEAKVDVGRAET